MVSGHTTTLKDVLVWLIDDETINVLDRFLFESGNLIVLNDSQITTILNILYQTSQAEMVKYYAIENFLIFLFNNKLFNDVWNGKDVNVNEVFNK